MSTIQMPEGWLQEAYTPAATRITSNRIGTAVPLKWAKFMLSADANVTWRDTSGGQVVAFPLKGGVPYPMLVTEISAVSAGTVIIMHDGQKFNAANP